MFLHAPCVQPDPLFVSGGVGRSPGGQLLAAQQALPRAGQDQGVSPAPDPVLNHIVSLHVGWSRGAGTGVHRGISSLSTPAAVKGKTAAGTDEGCDMTRAFPHPHIHLRMAMVLLPASVSYVDLPVGYCQ